MSTKQTVGKKVNIIYTKHLLPNTTERRQPGDSTLIINAVYMALTKKHSLPNALFQLNLHHTVSNTSFSRQMDIMLNAC